MIREKKNKDGTIKYEAKVKIAGRQLYQRFASYREAEAWVNERRYLRDKDLPVFVGKVTAKDLFEAYYMYGSNKGRAPTTLFRAKRCFEQHVLPFFEDHDIRTVTVVEHEKFLANLKRKRKAKQGLSPASINRIRSLMVVMFNVAIKKGLFNGSIQFNPYERVEKLAEYKRGGNYWSLTEIDQFLQSEHDSYYYPLWITLLNTGLRIGEIIGLDSCQIDTQAHILTVDRTWCHSTQKVRLVTKGKRIRHVGLNPTVQRALYPLVKTGQVFTRQDGSPLSHALIYKHLLPKACKRAGVKMLNPHGFRHSFGAQYMMHGGNLWDLQKILGHSDIKTTEEYYAHFSREHVQKRAQVIALGENLIEVNFNQGVA